MPINEERGYVMRHNLFLIFTVCNIFYAEAKRKEFGTNHTELLTKNTFIYQSKSFRAYQFSSEIQSYFYCIMIFIYPKAIQI